MIAPPSSRAFPHPLPGGWLIALLVGWLGVDQLLLWRFLDVMPFWAYGLGALLIGVLCVAIVRSSRSFAGPAPATWLLCIGVATMLLLLGGEGRFFYANIDWQVRFAVLRDISVNPWPFVYTARGEPDVLRAPIGMFLMPALAAKALGGRSGDIILLVQNSLLLGTLLALGSTLFATRRARLIALAVVIGFSGLDALGRVLFRGGLSDHLENWAYLQYSSTITLAFWVPQHALSGWIGALAFLLWRAEKLPLGVYLTLLPLTALWSPLGLIGAMPFAALAGVRSLSARAIRPADIALPAIATLLCIPGLLYLSAAGDGVGAKLVAILPLQWALFELLEILVYVLPLAFLVRQPRFGKDSLAVLTLWLLAIPFLQIGSSTDFMMRGSICALTILAVTVADVVRTVSPARPWLLLALSIGVMTPLTEIRRALVYPPAPEVRCSFIKAWEGSFWFQPKDTYLAPLDRMPSLVRPTNPYRASAVEPDRCWNGAWHHPDKPDVPLSSGQDRINR
ncbi:hypothetical protein EBBID32_9400 [Sphingobium indicum BiD32]|uniref:Uncharacterized protein n=1 Tax=Sphingobium indicum BiD32 TaxID=1301087 RepID=N1MM91_9SPHN|nr:hypothetical protein [Sphingobium indicum]CCW16603.1 hypothetical protein EBBID32_9400 [Sphingobium indicum BiD32]